MADNNKRAGGTKKARCIWESKKRKKRPRKACKIAEVFTTFEDEYQSLDEIENDPLYISPEKNTGEKKDVLSQVKNSQTETCMAENDSCIKEKTNENITLPSHILVTNIPRVGLVYTCENCARTFLSPQPASLHDCDCQGNDQDVKSKEEKKDLPLKSVAIYKCNECSKVFSRHSQLVSHKRTHFEMGSSSDETFTPTNQRMKLHARKTPKSKLSRGKNSFLINLNNQEAEITRHSLLSSESD